MSNSNESHLTFYEEIPPDAVLIEEEVITSPPEEVAGKIRDLELKSEEVQEVLGNPPHWLIRSGMSLIGIFITLILLVSFVLKYPDTISTQAQILGQNPPISVMARQSGKISHLFVKDNAEVVEGQVLSVIESLVNYEDLLRLQKWFEPLVKGDFSPAKIVHMPRLDLHTLQLGSLKTSLAELVKSLDEYRFFIQQDYHLNLIAKLQRDIDSHKELLEGMKLKQQMAIQSFVYTEKAYTSNELLLQQGAISEQEFEQHAKAYINEKSSLEDLDMGIRQKHMVMDGLEEQIRQNTHQSLQQSKQFQEQIRQSSTRLDAEIKQWRENYVLVAANAGVVSFFEFWNQKEDVKMGDEVMIILPETNDLYAYAKLEATNSGKVRPGQRVRIELTNFPAREFGTVKGVVESISPVARNGKYLLRMQLPHGLTTNYDKAVVFSQEMPATAHIVTEDLRIIDRIFYTFRETYKKARDE